MVIILLITYIITRFFEKKLFSERTKVMRICAWLPLHILFFHFHTFSGGRFPLFCRFFLLFGGSLRVVSVRFVLCFIRCFFGVFVCCFLIPGLRRGLFGDFGLFCGIFLMLAKMKGVSVNRCNLRMFRV